MKRIISLSLCLILLFNIGVTAFATKGDPLTEHPEYIKLIRKCFENQARLRQNNEAALEWKREPKFLFWTDNYRTVHAYNMPLLMAGKDRTDGFLHANAKALLDARKAAARSEVIAKMVGKPVAKIYIELLKKKLTGSSEIAMIADFLGTDEQTTIDSFICAAGMTFCSQVAHGLSVVACFTNILESLKPAAGIAVAGLMDAACYFLTKSALANEEAKNNAMALNSVFQKILNRPQDVIDSNLLVTAIDERKFNPILRYNAFRRDDGAWCDFVYIGGLKCAPRARDYQGGQLVNTYIDIYHRIMQDESLDLKALDDYIHGRLIPERPLHIVRVNSRTEEHSGPVAPLHDNNS